MKSIEKNSDSTTTIHQMRERAKTFSHERDWDQFHSPKEMVINLVRESTELLELFLWQNDQEIAQRIKDDPKFRQDIADELGDVVHSIVQFANLMEGCDVSKAFFDKMDKTEKKYPAATFRGKRSN